MAWIVVCYNFLCLDSVSFIELDWHNRGYPFNNVQFTVDTLFITINTNAQIRLFGRLVLIRCLLERIHGVRGTLLERTKHGAVRF